jgi:hypothetical protein
MNTSTLVLLALLVVVGCVDDDPPGSAPVEACTRAEVSTALWVRYWRGTSELACADAAAAGYTLEVSRLGGARLGAASVVWCDAIAADPAHRFGSGVYRFTAPRFVPLSVRALDARGQAASVETVVAHTPGECAFRAVERHVSIVLGALPRTRVP